MEDDETRLPFETGLSERDSLSAWWWSSTMHGKGSFLSDFDYEENEEFLQLILQLSLLRVRASS